MTKTELLKQLKRELAELHEELKNEELGFDGCDFAYEKEEELMRRIAELESTN